MIRTFLIVSLLVSVAGVASFAEEPAAGPEALAEEWSLRLMQEKARIDHARKRLDEANAAYARAIAKDEDDLVIASFETRRESALVDLEKAEARLPRLVEEARAAGVDPKILDPYRFAVAPADAR